MYDFLPKYSDVINDREAVESFNEVRKLMKDSPICQILLSRRFRNPAKYPTWEHVAGDITVECMMGQTEKWESIDITKQQCITNSMQMVHDQGPIYWCDRSLLESLMQTEAPAGCGLNKLFNTAVFMFPDNWLRDPDGWPVRYAIVSQVLPDEKLPAMKIGGAGIPRRELISVNANHHRLSIHTTVETGASYWKGLRIQDDGSADLESENPEYRQATPLSEAESEFAEKLALLIYQVMLVMQSIPDMVLEAAPAKKKKASKRSPSNLLNPIWIGRGFKTQKGTSTQPVGTHASPQTHWRTGHWRRVPCGQGRKERKWQWIRPTLVNA